VTGSERGRVIAALLAVQVLFGLHYLASKVVLGAIPPAAWAVLRILPAAAIVLAVWLARERRRAVRTGPRPPVAVRDLAALAVFALFGVVVNQVCFVEGLARTTPSHSALINTTIPITTILFAIVLRRERLRAARLLGILLSFGGVLILLRVDALEIRAEWFLGDLLTLINASSFGLFLVISKDTIRRLGPTAATAGIFCFGALGIAAYGGPAAAELDVAAVPTDIWVLAALIVVFPTVLTYFLNYWALARVDSSLVALFIYLQPIIAAALSAALLAEPVTGRLLVSSLFVFAGVYVATQVRGRR
jgi:drug/metabolite transporter (DMT)-like permease